TVISVSVIGAEPLKLRDLVDGVIPNGTVSELSDNNSYTSIRGSIDLYNAIDGDNAVLVINGATQSKTESLAYMQDLGDGNGPGVDPTPSLTENAENVVSAKPFQTQRVVTGDRSIDIGNQRLSNAGFVVSTEELASGRTFYSLLVELGNDGTTIPFYWAFGPSSPIPSISDKS
nr:hypothetical protein [Gammaproteobacteria bacterium]